MLMFALCSGADEIVPPPRALRFDGTFLEYQGRMTSRSADSWRDDMRTLEAMKMDTIVIRWLSNGKERFMPLDPAEANRTTNVLGFKVPRHHLPKYQVDGPDAVDATEVILEYADATDMRVYLGLAYERGWWDNALNAEFFGRLASVQGRVIKRAWQLYGKHKSFAGWFIPQETWDFNPEDERLKGMHGYIKRLSARCKKVSGNKPVAISAFFGGQTGPEEVERIYMSFLKDAPVDILMLQDGVGPRDPEAGIEETVAPYFEAFRNACAANGVEFWASLDAFTQDLRPAETGRIGRQLAAESPFVSRVIVSEYFRYMSPYRGRAQLEMQEEYVREFVAQDYRPEE